MSLYELVSRVVSPTSVQSTCATFFSRYSTYGQSSGTQKRLSTNSHVEVTMSSVLQPDERQSINEIVVCDHLDVLVNRRTPVRSHDHVDNLDADRFSCDRPLILANKHISSIPFCSPNNSASE
jgi:hypothetical protein